MYKHLLQINEDQTNQTQKPMSPQNKTVYFSTNQIKQRKGNYLLRKKTNQLWRLSATTMTRDNSPSFKIPKSPRFLSIEQDRRKNPSFLSLELRKCLDRGVTFPQSTRKNHFVKKDAILQPSCTSYFKQEPSKQINFLQFANPQNSSELYMHSNVNSSRSSRNKKDSFTIKKFEKVDKLYLHHGRQINYQPQITKDNPGVGKYNVTESKIRQNSPSYSFRKILQRFNEHDYYNPGPGAYKIHFLKPNKTKSINEKGTFENSNRQFLRNPDNLTPGPGAYKIN